MKSTMKRLSLFLVFALVAGASFAQNGNGNGNGNGNSNAGGNAGGNGNGNNAGNGNTPSWCDQDGDGFNGTGLFCGGDDCDDNDASVHPKMWYIDNDGDGWGGQAIGIQCYTYTPNGRTDKGGDCNDNDPMVYPGRMEVCDGKDNDCDGQTDEGLATQTYYRDIDGDGFGNLSVSVQNCSQPNGYVQIPGDCNDNNATVYPGAPEICDNRDNNCDGTIDEGVRTAFYEDADGDGFGRINIWTNTCVAPPNHVAVSGDCDDNDITVFPGAPELCDGIDNDCDGSVDNSCADTDGDGVVDALDNCPNTANPMQMDTDGDAMGDACDCDINDPALTDNCPTPTYVDFGTILICDGQTETLDAGCNYFSYLWNDAAASTTSEITVSAAGTYECVVTYEDGFSYIKTWTVEMAAPVGVIIKGAGTPACFGETVGLNAGMAASFLWDDANASTTQIIHVTESGTYNVIVTDANGCTGTDDVVVTIGDEILANIATVNSCSNSCTGEATVNVTGDAGSLTYAWSNGATTPTITDLCTGTYSVVVTDINGCTATATADVYSSTDMVLTSSSTKAYCSNEGTATVGVTSGGSVPFTYAWDDDNNQATDVATDLVPGTYNAIVTDAAGCTATTSANVTRETACTQVHNIHCGLTVGSTSTYINCYPAAGASAYRFQFVGQTDGSVHVSNDLTSTQCWLNNLQTDLSFNQTYSVSVAVLADLGNGPEWSSFGVECDLTLGQPAPGVHANHCNLTLGSTSTYINGYPFGNYYQQELKFVGQTTGTEHIVTGVSTAMHQFWLNQTDNQMIYDETYDIYVRVVDVPIIVNGTSQVTDGPWNQTSCELTLTLPQAGMHSNSCDLTLGSVSTYLTGYPQGSYDQQEAKFVGKTTNTEHIVSGVSTAKHQFWLNQTDNQMIYDESYDIWTRLVDVPISNHDGTYTVTTSPWHNTNCDLTITMPTPGMHNNSCDKAYGTTATYLTGYPQGNYDQQEAKFVGKTTLTEHAVEGVSTAKHQFWLNQTDNQLIYNETYDIWLRLLDVPISNHDGTYTVTDSPWNLTSCDYTLTMPNPGMHSNSCDRTFSSTATYLTGTPAGNYDQQELRLEGQSSSTFHHVSGVSAAKHQYWLNQTDLPLTVQSYDMWLRLVDVPINDGAGNWSVTNSDWVLSACDLHITGTAMMQNNTINNSESNLMNESDFGSSSNTGSSSNKAVLSVNGVEKSAPKASIFPNPATLGTLNFKLEELSIEDADVVLIDPFGKQVSVNKLTPVNGMINKQFSTHGMSAGMYMIRVVQGEDAYHYNVVIE